jgi:recombination DNA repair RAD52 pathway protein
VGLSFPQVDVLLRSINPVRILSRKQAGQSLSYLAAYEVRAHLIRVFGFAEFSVDALTCETLFNEYVNAPTERNPDRMLWEVGVRASVRLTIHATGATYTEYAVGGAQLPTRAEALDMATKTAVSDATKRAATNLGDQFGLSLYDNGSTTALVRGLIDPPRAPKADEKREDGSAAPARNLSELERPVTEEAGA